MKETTLFYSYSITDTKNIAKIISKKLTHNSCIYISGEMGTGKTNLSKFIASHFGINDLTSATYSKVSSFRGILNIVHCDFYNIKPNQNFIETEVLPILVVPWLLIVEWPKIYYEIDCQQLVFIKLETIGNCSRKISFSRSRQQ